MFKRQMQAIIKEYSKFPVIAILGPRQSGKTTLAQMVFKRHKFVSLEHPRAREFAAREPERFLQTHENKYGIILDEFQHVPEILSYIQLDVDAKKRKNYFVLTGSHNFLMNQAITQSLAGRAAILTLPPLSLQELIANRLLNADVHEVVFNGGYPRLYDEGFLAQKFYPAYIQTYVERDVRQLINIGDLGAFQKFIQLCAGRIGNLLNLSDLAAVCGVSVPTASRWISLLQASYIIFLLEPHHQNFNKRLTKMPKLYFYDTGLACNLLRIDSAQDLLAHHYWGSLFENFVIADLMKQYCNLGMRPALYFWRDKNGRIEVDCLVDRGGHLTPIEIKGGQAVAADYFDSLNAWKALASGVRALADTNAFLIYAGSQGQTRTAATVLAWDTCGQLIKRLIKK